MEVETVSKSSELTKAAQLKDALIALHGTKITALIAVVDT
jgi:hypothetical protein